MFPSRAKSSIACERTPALSRLPKSDHDRPLLLLIEIFFATLFAILAPVSQACASDLPVSVRFHSDQGSFALIQNSRPSAILIDADADPAVKHVANSFAADLNRVSGRMPLRLTEISQADGALILIGVLHHSALIDELLRAGKIEAADLDGQWEAYHQIVVDHPPSRRCRGRW